MGGLPYFSAIITSKNNFCDFLFVSLDDLNFPNEGYYWRKKILPLMKREAKKETERVASPDSNLIHFRKCLTLKVPITTAADDSLEHFSFFFPDKIMLELSCESSAWQRIHMKHQALFSSKNKSKNNKSVLCFNFAWCFKG